MGAIQWYVLSRNFLLVYHYIELIPDDWQKGIVKPLHKSGSVYDLDNYRGITLSSNVYKLFTKTLEISVLDHLESKNILGENHVAFRKSRRLENHLFTLQGISRELEYFFSLQNSTLDYMTKTLNQIFFFLHQNQNIFSATLGIRIFF